MAALSNPGCLPSLLALPRGLCAKAPSALTLRSIISVYWWTVDANYSAPATSGKSRLTLDCDQLRPQEPFVFGGRLRRGRQWDEWRGTGVGFSLLTPSVSE